MMMIDRVSKTLFPPRVTLAAVDGGLLAQRGGDVARDDDKRLARNGEAVCVVYPGARLNVFV